MLVEPAGHKSDPPPRELGRFPGFGYAAAIFATYCAGEWFYNRLAGGKGGHH